MLKYNRNYLLRVDGLDIQPQPPLTLEFDISRKWVGSPNNFSLRLYNLSEKHRDQLRRDFIDYAEFRGIELLAGYGDQMHPILVGNISQCWSVREGSNFITFIEGFDAGFAFTNAVINTPPLPENYPQRTVIKQMLSTLDQFHVKLGAVGNYPGTTGRGNSYEGNTLSKVNELAPGGLFVDNGVAHCLQENECLADEIFILSSQSGLLGTPKLEQTMITVEMIFEPQVIVGQRVLIQSDTNESFNRLCKIVGIHHKGTISGAICGDAITSLNLLQGEFFDPVVSGA